ncbi:glycosyltransferase [Candidatus Bathyarchaeota archaeon]|nr:glycosyltransferase [Candidatus Bathyarchaeota archaeon]
MGTLIGFVTSFVALTCGCIFFIYALKYYASTIISLSEATKKFLLKKNIYLINGSVPLKSPFISVHIPFYNEGKVAHRIIDACINLDYLNFEVLIADDSTDETIEVLKDVNWRKTKPVVKFIHRNDRSGFKGGALSEALKYMNPLTEFVVVFDADFIPPSDILLRFVEHYNKFNKNDVLAEKINTDTLAAIQGYQLHYLNKSENWVTRGVRAEFSGSYMVERVAVEYYGGLKMISGSVFFIRADILKDFKWSKSITEDWELTLRLYLNGYKVIYTPLIQAPAEIPSTIKALAKQRMRWAEGHTFSAKKFFWRIINSPNLSIFEKIEFIYFVPYYLQSVLLVIGSLSWLITEINHSHPWFWSPLFGWSLLLSNFLAVPIMGFAGLFLEGDLKNDYSGVFSFIVLSYILAPFQGYAALKGLFEKEEGLWFRTFKSGSITDKVLNIKFRGLITKIKTIKTLFNNHKFNSSIISISTFKHFFTFSAFFLMILPIITALFNFFW